MWHNGRNLVKKQIEKNSFILHICFQNPKSCWHVWLNSEINSHLVAMITWIIEIERPLENWFLQRWVKEKSVSEPHWAWTLNLEQLLWSYLIVPTEICNCYYIGQTLPQRSDHLFFMESIDIFWQLMPEFSCNHRSSRMLITPALFQWRSNCSPATNYWPWFCIYSYFFNNWKKIPVQYVALH